MSNPTNTTVASTVKKDLMPVCNCWLKLDKNGSNILKMNVTPAEMFALVAEHHINAGGECIHDIEKLPDVERTDEQEFNRLQNKFSPDKIAKLFPTPIPQFPKTFEEAQKLGTKMNVHGKDKFSTIARTSI